jgi:hypothetical protein
MELPSLAWHDDGGNWLAGCKQGMDWAIRDIKADG